MTAKLNRDEDGITHINCWSKGRTVLGQLLSNFANTPFDHPQHGSFASVEGFWYWCATGMQDRQLKRLYGASAKSYGKKLTPVALEEAVFRDLIRSAIRCKLEQNAQLREMFIASELPFEHYYVYGPKVDVIVQKDEHRWQMDYLEELRDLWRRERGLPLPAHRTAPAPDFSSTASVETPPAERCEPSPF